MLLLLLLANLISFTVSPTTCLAPCDLVLRVRVEPAPDNDKVAIQVEGEQFYRFTEIPYNNGGNKSFQVTYKGVPAGNYEIIVYLHKHDGKSWVAGIDKKIVKVVEG